MTTYDYESRTNILGIPTALLAEHGAVSPEAVLAMAEAVRAAFHADIGIASTGVAGPSGRNVGCLWLAIADDEHSFTEHHDVTRRSRLAMHAEFTRITLRMLFRHVSASH